MSPLQGGQAPVESRGTQRSSFVHAAARKQRGVALLIVLVALGLLVGMLAIGFAGDLVRQNQSQQRTTDALAQAKEALIGRAVSDDDRPGSLLCPDTDDDGSAELFGGNDCPSYIGRLPWKTLGLPDLRDSDGERLWYALSNRFRDHGTAEPINSDTKGNRTVYSESITVTFTAEAVAVIFAPGAIVSSQVRDIAISAACAAPPGPIATTLCAANYLEATGGADNAVFGGAGPFVSAQRSDTFNDRLLVITTPDLIPVVEQRVAREMLALLESYRTAPANSCPNDCYTWADEDFNNEGDNDAFRGWLPLGEADPYDWSVPPPIPVGLNIAVPNWLTNNDWWKVVYYAVAPDKTENDSGGTLTVDGVPGTLAVLITPGPAGANRPVNPPGTSLYWAEYLNDPENSDHNDNTYVTPSSSAYARDRIYVLP